MQDTPRAQDPGFVVEWQLTDDLGPGSDHGLIDLSAEPGPVEIALPDDRGIEATSHR
jgi:hypothetical protein